MKFLFIVDYYGPTASANGICVEKIVDALVCRCEDVSVLTFGDRTDRVTSDGTKMYSPSSSVAFSPFSLRSYTIVGTTDV